MNARCVWRPASINGHLAQCKNDATKQFWNQLLCESHFERIVTDNAK